MAGELHRLGECCAIKIRDCCVLGFLGASVLWINSWTVLVVD